MGSVEVILQKVEGKWEAVCEKVFERPPVAVWPVSNGRGLGWKAGAGGPRGLRRIQGSFQPRRGRPWWP